MALDEYNIMASRLTDPILLMSLTQEEKELAMFAANCFRLLGDFAAGTRKNAVPISMAAEAEGIYERLVGDGA